METKELKAKDIPMGYALCFKYLYALSRQAVDKPAGTAYWSGGVSYGLAGWRVPLLLRETTGKKGLGI